MDKLLKIGLVCMLAAVVLMPVAVLLGTGNKVLFMAFAMLLELIGLIFVIISIIKQRKSKAPGHD